MMARGGRGTIHKPQYYYLRQDRALKIWKWYCKRKTNRLINKHLFILNHITRLLYKDVIYLILQYLISV